jgi:acyl-CoA thioesterase
LPVRNHLVLFGGLGKKQRRRQRGRQHMAGLIEATALIVDGDRCQVQLDPGWDIWGPAGGYIAAIALRAAGAHAAPGHRPLTLTGQFVRVAKPGLLDVEVVPVKSGGTALFAITLSQAGQPVFLAQVWTSARNEPSIPLQPPMPDVPPPLALRDQDELVAERGLPQMAFWRNLEGRPVNFRLAGDPLPTIPNQYRWMRYRDWPDASDPFLDAMRAALLIDIGVWPGHWYQLVEPADYLAPSLDIAVQFHDGAPAGDWLLSDADSAVSGHGCITGRVRIWSQDGRAIATGTGQCLVTRPRAPG